MRTRATILLMLIMMHGCVDPLPYAVKGGENVLVVDGMMTDGPGPYTVRLFLAGDPLQDQRFPTMVDRASVSIIDDEDREFDLPEVAPGIYQSDPNHLRGEAGRTYWLKVLLRDGAEFHSSKETILPPGDINRIHYRYESDVMNSTDPALPQDAVTFYVDAKSDQVNTKGLQRWVSSGIYEIATFPWLRTKWDSALQKEVPDPLPCSGYISVNYTLQQVDTCACCTCWVYESPRDVAIASGQFTSNNEFRNIQVARLAVDPWRFFRKYRIEVEQLSVSEEVYEFWKRVRAQREGTGSLFQPNATKVKGNITSIGRPDLEVFGIFTATSVTRSSLSVVRGDFPEPIAGPSPQTIDCRGLFNSTNIRPPSW